MEKGAAKVKAKESAQRYRVYRHLKKAKGLISEEAIHASQILASRELMNDLMRLNTNYPVSKREIAMLNQIWLAVKLVHEEKVNELQVLDFAKEYVSARVTEKWKPLSNKLILKLSNSILKKNRLRVSKYSVDTSVLSFGGLTRVASSYHFFTRAQTESGLHKIPYQQRGLELAFGEISENDRVSFFRSLAKKVNDPISIDDEIALSQKIKGWSDMPDAARTRILQEKRTNVLGTMLADVMGEAVRGKIADSKKALQKYPNNKIHKVWLEYWGWIQSCLKRPGNRQFLAQLVVRRFAKKKIS